MQAVQWLPVNSPQLRAALLVALCSFAALTTAQDFVQVKVTDIDSKAVCNDGSPGMYFFRPGTGTGANKCVFSPLLLQSIKMRILSVAFCVL